MESLTLDPHMQVLRLEGRKFRNQCDVRCVAAIGDGDATRARFFLSGIKGVPASVDEGLEPGVKIHGIQSEQIAHDHASGNAERAAQRDADVRKISTHAGLVAQGIDGARRAIAHAVAIFDVLTDERAKGFDLVVPPVLPRTISSACARRVSDGQ